MGGKIFINYRRNDDPGFTQALFLRLEDEFPAEDLFMDVEGYIKPGDDFVEVLSNKVAGADVLLVVIGQRWAELLAARKGDTDDFVSIEIMAALDLGKRVIPVLVGDASMPRADMLPEAIRQLARRNAVGIRPDRFKADCQGLVTALKETLGDVEKEQAARTETERRLAEAARLEAEAQAAARAKAAEERGRAQASAGLSAEEIRKAEELASWDFVKDRASLQELRDHLARFPAGTTERYALAKLDALVWAALGSKPKIEQLRAYIDEFPKGENAATAHAQIESMERSAATERAAQERARKEIDAWAAASGTDTQAAYMAYLDAWPDGEHVGSAEARLWELRLGPRRHRIAAGLGVLGGLIGLWGLYAISTDLIDALRPLPAFSEPDMATISPGEIAMGSNDYPSERPIHTVAISKPFAVGRYEVTFDEWDICVQEGGCKQVASAEGWGRGRRPVVNIAWIDAKQYVEWLANKTKKPYRLPSEAEWEYSARAHTKTRYAFGDEITSKQAQFAAPKTAEVGSFQPNAFGLYDMHGNVWEWVEDCATDSYTGAPADGSPNLSGNCARREVRGGSWRDVASNLRSAVRNNLDASRPFYDVGFRVARTPTP